MAVMDGVATTLLEPRPLPNFVATPFIEQIVERALLYVGAGFPIHFRGEAGTGKTTLAMHVAARVGRPVVLIHGDEEFSTSDLVGAEHGYRHRKVVDRYIHSVLKTEEDMQRRWTDNRLTVACRYGFTLVYDEFTRSRAEANNVLLAVLQEKMLDMPSASGGAGYLQVHPDFTAIFTSNPSEYAGVHLGQDALRDRLATLDLGHFDEETEIRITSAKSGIAQPDAEVIVRLVRGLRESGACEVLPTVRSCILLARTLHAANAAAARDGLFRRLCLDILASQSSRDGTAAHQARVRETLDGLLDRESRLEEVRAS